MVGRSFRSRLPRRRAASFISSTPPFPRRGGNFRARKGGGNFGLTILRWRRGRFPLAGCRWRHPGIAVQRASDNTRLPDPPPQEAAETLHALWYENRVAVSRPSEGETTPGSGRPVAATGPSQASETEMDELARKLYDRIRGRLKTELLVDL